MRYQQKLKRIAQKSHNINKICHAFQFVISAAQVEMRDFQLCSQIIILSIFSIFIFFSEFEDIQDSFSVDAAFFIAKLLSRGPAFLLAESRSSEK